MHLATPQHAVGVLTCNGCRPGLQACGKTTVHQVHVVQNSRPRHGSILAVASFLGVLGVVCGQSVVLPAASTDILPGGIPRIIHQVFLSGQDALHAEETTESAKFRRDWRRSCQVHNPDWQYILWDQAMAEELLSTRYPRYLEAFTSIKTIVLKGDAIRPFILHAYGGVYLDMDTECFGPLETSLTGSSLALQAEALLRVNNAQMASGPGHPLWVMLQRRIKSMVTDPAGWSEENMGPREVLLFAGPAALSMLLRRYLGVNATAVLAGTSYYDTAYFKAQKVQGLVQVQSLKEWFQACEWDRPVCRLKLARCGPLIRAALSARWRIKQRKLASNPARRLRAELHPNPSIHPVPTSPQLPPVSTAYTTLLRQAASADLMQQIQLTQTQRLQRRSYARTPQPPPLDLGPLQCVAVFGGLVGAHHFSGSWIKSEDPLEPLETDATHFVGLREPIDDSGSVQDGDSVGGGGEGQGSAKGPGGLGPGSSESDDVFDPESGQGGSRGRDEMLGVSGEGDSQLVSVEQDLGKQQDEGGVAGTGGGTLLNLQDRTNEMKLVRQYATRGVLAFFNKPSLFVEVQLTSQDLGQAGRNLGQAAATTMPIPTDTPGKGVDPASTAAAVQAAPQQPVNASMGALVDAAWQWAAQAGRVDPAGGCQVLSVFLSRTSEDPGFCCDSGGIAQARVQGLLELSDWGHQQGCRTTVLSDMLPDHPATAALTGRGVTVIPTHLCATQLCPEGSVSLDMALRQWQGTQSNLTRLGVLHVAGAGAWVWSLLQQLHSTGSPMMMDLYPQVVVLDTGPLTLDTSVSLVPAYQHLYQELGYAGYHHTPLSAVALAAVDTGMSAQTQEAPCRVCNSTEVVLPALRLGLMPLHTGTLDYWKR